MSNLDWYVAYRPIGGDRYLCLARLTLGRLRLIVATEDAPGEHW